MKDRRTKEEILAEHESLKAAHVGLAEVAEKLGAELKAVNNRSDDWQKRYYKLLEEHKTLRDEHLSERSQSCSAIDQLADRAVRYSAMRGAVIAMAGKAKADEIDGYV